MEILNTAKDFNGEDLYEGDRIIYSVNDCGFVRGFIFSIFEENGIIFYIDDEKYYGYNLQYKMNSDNVILDMKYKNKKYTLTKI